MKKNNTAKKILPRTFNFDSGEHQFEVHGLISIDVRNGFVFVTSAMGTSIEKLEYDEFKKRLSQ